MSPHLPQRVDPWQSCARNRAYEGRVPLADLERLAPLLASVEGEAAFTLEFDRDPRHGNLVWGHVAAELVVTCQRCLGPQRLAVSQDFRLRLVQGLDEVERLDEELDPLWVEDDQLDLRDIVEDELILAVPHAPRHPADQCAAAAGGTAPAGAADADEVGRENPFAVLAALKPGKPDN